jgi:hypothetical protein
VESTWNIQGVQVEYMEYTRSLEGVHSYPWGSVTYSMLVDYTHIAFASAVPAHSIPVLGKLIPAEPVSVDRVLANPVPVNTVPVNYVRIDPVSVASANPNPITFIIKKLPSHQISIHLAYVKSSQFFRVRWRGFGS